MLNSRTESIPVINRDVALRRLGGDAQLFATVAGFFLQDAEMLMRELHDAHRAADFGTIVHRAHSLKGLASTFEAIPFIETARIIESVARTQDASRLDLMVPRLDHEYHRLIAHLHSFAE
jgi:two-component system, sensor histidine kinase and response regulator